MVNFNEIQFNGFNDIKSIKCEPHLHRIVFHCNLIEMEFCNFYWIF